MFIFQTAVKYDKTLLIPLYINIFIYIYVAKIKYPPEPESSESERIHAQRMMMNNRQLPQKPSSIKEEEEEEELVDPTMKLTPQVKLNTNIFYIKKKAIQLTLSSLHESIII